ncbi:MAG: hypothetical protein EB832_00010 [Thaumarchaeota archaeon S14]|nr:MAG: hypothetical protein EB832_00010 [Thaumarchaeota archaeon S14]
MPGGKGGRRGGGAPDTLEVENTARIRYLLEAIKGAYYVNLRVRQDVALGQKGRADEPSASPELTLKLVVLAKYLFLEIWMLGMEGTVREAICGMERDGRPGPARALRQDLETMKFINDMRHKFSAHPTFPLCVAIERIEQGGFARFWQCARRLLLLREAVGAAPGKGRPPCRALEPCRDVAGIPYGLPTREEQEDATNRHESPEHDVKWPEANSRQIMQECAMCIRALLEEFRVSLELHRRIPDTANRERLCRTAYSTKYAVLEMGDFIDRYKDLRLSDMPRFLDQEKKYEKYRNQYAAHRDKFGRVVSLLQLLGSPIMPNLILDMHEAICLSRRLFPMPAPAGGLVLPTLDEINQMEAEICAFRQDLHEWAVDGAAGAEHRRECAEFHAHIKRVCGLD